MFIKLQVIQIPPQKLRPKNGPLNRLLQTLPSAACLPGDTTCPRIRRLRADTPDPEMMSDFRWPVQALRPLWKATIPPDPWWGRTQVKNQNCAILKLGAIGTYFSSTNNANWVYVAQWHCYVLPKILASGTRISICGSWGRFLKELCSWTCKARPKPARLHKVFVKNNWTTQLRSGSAYATPQLNF
jgi:hypothetical protein